MENKYYTPTIEEFHVGFEFETNNVSTLSKEKQIWKQMIATPNIIGAIDYDLSTNSREGIYRNESIRVKYLDQSDIESLGWVKHNINKNCYYIELHKNTFGTIYMEYYDEQETKWCIESDRHGETIFIGTIKNKSQLKFIMKCLGILE